MFIVNRTITPLFTIVNNFLMFFINYFILLDHFVKSFSYHTLKKEENLIDSTLNN